MNWDRLADKVDRMMTRGDAWRAPAAVQNRAPVETVLFGQSGGRPPAPLVWIAKLDGTRVKYYSKTCCGCFGSSTQPYNDVGEFINFHGWKSVFDGRTWRNWAGGMRLDANLVNQCSYDPNWIAAQQSGDLAANSDYKAGGREIGGIGVSYITPGTYSPGMALNTADWGYDLSWSRVRWNARNNQSNTGSPGVIGGSQTLHVLMSLGFWRLDLPAFTRCNVEPRDARWVPFFHCYWAGVHVQI